MPVYEYQCPRCGEKTDVVKEVADYKRVEFCGCGSELTRKLSPFGISMVGSNVNGHRYSVGDVQALSDGTYGD
jgi:putative FmdB family regulatory protein